MAYAPLAVKVWGERACFTRPEMKAERVSYEVITPSAARGVLEAIFWKPQFRWQVRHIHVLQPIRHFSMVRNEVSSRMSPRSPGLDVTECRAQRHTLGLRDVAYVITAEVAVKPDVGDDPAKYRDQFRRRLAKGQCYHRPYLGCREFAADFAAPDGSERPVDLDEPLGLMLLDIEFRPDGRQVPHFFEAALRAGVLAVPAYDFTTGEGGAT